VVSRLLLGVGLVVLVGGAACAWRLTRPTPAEHAREAVAALVASVGPAEAVHVSSCAKIRGGADAHLYQCDVAGDGCTRSFLFAVYRESAVTYDPRAGLLRRPCLNQTAALPSLR
jgi:hypothetical protein